MGGLFPADHSGLAGVMFGLVGLVLFGVTITLVMDGQLMSGSAPPAIDTTIAENDARIAGLVKQIDLLKHEQNERNGWKAGLATLEAAKKELAALAAQIAPLKQDLARERLQTAETTEAFAEYRTTHRNRLWAHAVGEQMDELRVRGGKVYKGVTIRSVSAVELKIAHASGSATLAVRDLPAELMDTYLLSPGEARRINKAERKRERELAAAKAATEEAARAPARRPPSRTRTKETGETAEARARKEAEIRVLRAEVTQLRSQISVLASQISEARMQAAYGKRRSPPGSLETWSQRLSKLSAQDGQLRARLSMQEGQLRRLDPSYRPPMPSRTR